MMTKFLEFHPQIEAMHINKESTHCISKKLGISQTYIYKYLVSKNLTRSLSDAMRKYTYDGNFFHKIDIPLKAYILGFVYADGCVTRFRNRFIIGLSRKDKSVLEFIKYSLKYDGPIADTSVFDNRYKKRRYRSRLEIYSEKIVSHLIDKGCFPNKSLTLKWPTDKQVPNRLKWHFLRGYFDGDGSIIERAFVSNMCVSIEFGELLKIFLESYDIFSCLRPIGKVCMIELNRKQDNQKFFLNLYQNSENMRLDRKYQTYLNHQQK